MSVVEGEAKNYRTFKCSFERVGLQYSNVVNDIMDDNVYALRIIGAAEHKLARMAFRSHD